MDHALSRRTLLGGVLAATQTVRSQRNSSKPNFVVILFDDLGVHDLGYLGASDLKTPNIDKLAAGGTVCRNWYSNAPVCAPARSSLMTGRVPQRNGVISNGSPLRPTEKSIASLLKSNGYATGAVGKWHLGSTPDTASIISMASWKAASIIIRIAFIGASPSALIFTICGAIAKKSSRMANI
jgi:hypothetical protein